ncbi:MAG TPA: DUF3553 domain-containing protein, partial [Nannocystis sp.]
ADLGALEVAANGELAVAEDAANDPAALAEDAAALDQRHLEQARARIDEMRAYAECFDCRREQILRHFGEPDTAIVKPCAACDNCDAGHGELLARMEADAPPRPPAEEPAPAPSEPFPVESTVVHAEWGRGRVLRYAEGKIVVDFADVGEKTLGLDFVAARNLLTPA